MAKQYEQFKREYDDLTHKTQEMVHQIAGFDATKENLTKIIGGGAMEIGIRVQELKDKGHQGTTLNDFAADPEVHAMTAKLNTVAARLDADTSKLNAMKGPGTALLNGWGKLQQELTSEINARKKELSTKLGMGNKSLPSMEKLLLELQKSLRSDGPVDTLRLDLDQIDRPGFGAMWRDLEVAGALKNTKATLSNAQSEMLQQMLDLRHLNTSVNSAKKLYEDVLEACKKVEEVAKTGDAKKLAQVKLAPVKPAADLVRLVAQFEKALSDPAIAKAMNGADDGSKVKERVKLMVEIRTKCDAKLKATEAALKSFKAVGA